MILAPNFPGSSTVEAVVGALPLGPVVGGTMGGGRVGGGRVGGKGGTLRPPRELGAPRLAGPLPRLAGPLECERVLAGICRRTS